VLTISAIFCRVHRMRDENQRSVQMSEGMSAVRGVSRNTNTPVIILEIRRELNITKALIL
jgi:hypothetical protein